MRSLYTIAIYLYYIIIWIAALFHPKARLWIKGRKGVFAGLKSTFSKDDPLFWFHCASLGEFEQGRPLIEELKLQYPDHKILLTFYSPSGYEIRKDYELADHICYLPNDTPAKARKLLKIINPEAVFFIKYEFWYNILKELKSNKVATYMVSGIFREDQYFFRSYGSWFRKGLRAFSWFFVQDETSQTLLQEIGIDRVSLSGDTRFDRVAKVAKSVKSFPDIEVFTGDSRIFLAGSTWPQDEEKLCHIIENMPDIKMIIAPHEVHEQHIQQLQKTLPVPSLRYSSFDPGKDIQERVLIIDSIGILGNLYQYASIAFIGGGFTKGIHNILEAATFGVPVVFGPNYHIFKEAHDLISLEGAFTVKDERELLEIVQKLSEGEGFYSRCSKSCSDYIQNNIGATAHILDKINS